VYILGDSISAQIPSVSSLKTAKSRAMSLTRLHSDPISALNIMKCCTTYSSTIRNIGHNGFYVHFWSNLQIQIYKESYSKLSIPTISFDATGGCCKKIQRPEGNKSSHLFLYEGVMNVDGKTFTVLSMISEQHDTLSIYMWLTRWLRCGVKTPKMVISDQSLAIMSALVQSFTQYKSLQEYLEICFKFTLNKINKNKIPSCYIRNDINHFVNLISKWTPLKKSKFPRTKQLFVRSMTLLVYCKSMDEAKKILEAIFKIALSKYDGPLLVPTVYEKDTPCAISKRYLQTLISNKSSYLQEFDDLIDENNIISENNVNKEIEDNEDICEDFVGSFENWASLIADDCRSKIDKIEGEFDNAQYTPELIPLVIKCMKLYPCWSGIMTKWFGYGEATVSSSRVESNFNQIKNRVFKTENLPIRVDDFVQKLINYYKGDNLLLQNTELLTKKSVNDEETHTGTDVDDDVHMDIQIETDNVNNFEIHTETDIEGNEETHTDTCINEN